MSTLTAAAVRAVLAQHTDEVFLTLLTLTHPSITTVRLVNNTVDVVSRGQTYRRYPFDLPLPSDMAESLSSLTLSLSNIDQALIAELRSITNPIAVTLELIVASAPDVVQQGPYSFDLIQVGGDEQQLSGELSYEPVVSDPFPAATFNPQANPGLFGRT